MSKVKIAVLIVLAGLVMTPFFVENFLIPKPSEPTPVPAVATSTPTATATPTVIPTPGRTCITAEVSWPDNSYGFPQIFWIGNSQLCARLDVETNTLKLEIADLLVAPDYDAVVSGLENSISEWKDCAFSRLLCKDWQLEEINK